MGSTYEIVLVVINILGMTLGTILICLGIRGHMLLTHSRCRTCSHHLGPHATRSDCCPECGVELYWNMAVRFHRRVFRKRMIIGGILLFLLAFIVPRTAEAVRLRIFSNATVPQIAGAPTSLNPQEMSFQALISVAKNKPDAFDIWTELANRNLSAAELRTAIETFVDLNVNPDVVRIPEYKRLKFKGKDELYRNALSRLNPSDESDISLMTDLISIECINKYWGWPQRPNSPLSVSLNNATNLSLETPLDFPSHWKLKFNSVEMALNGKTILKKTEQQSSHSMTLRVPTIPYETRDQNHVLSIVSSITISSGTSPGAATWNLEPQLDFPLKVISTGETAAIYRELESLPQKYIEVFERTRVTAWSLPNSEETMFAINIPLLRGGKPGESGAMHMNVIPKIPNPEEIDGNNTMTGYFKISQNGNGASYGGKETTRYYRAPGILNQGTIDIALEPRLLIDSRNNKFTLRGEYMLYGLLGSRVLIENIPVNWIDRPDQSRDTKDRTPIVRAERIGTGEGSGKTTNTDPLFGPSLTTSNEDTESAALLAAWLKPTLLTSISKRTGKRMVQLQFGSKEPLPICAQLKLSISNLGKSSFSRLLSTALTPESTRNFGDQLLQRGACFFGPIEEELLPGTLAKIEVHGLPGCVRRDQRDKEKWFGGSFTMEIPVIEGKYKYNKDRRSYFLVSLEEEDS